LSRSPANDVGVFAAAGRLLRKREQERDQTEKSILAIVRDRV
jgi:hypothetical protein